MFWYIFLTHVCENDKPSTRFSPHSKPIGKLLNSKALILLIIFFGILAWYISWYIS